ALTPNAVIPRFTNSIPQTPLRFCKHPHRLRDFATFFLCCLPSIGLVEQCEGDICDAVALDRWKDRIDERRHCDNRNLPRRNRREVAVQWREVARSAPGQLLRSCGKLLNRHHGYELLPQ